MSDTDQHLSFETCREELLPALQNVELAMVGKSDVVRLMFMSVLAGGHCLIEDVPGVGKTLLAKAVAQTCGCEFQRIQFTPDLLPSDVTGVTIYHAELHQFEFRKGPIFGQVVLADEINRSSPRTQSALLEAMEEGTVTVDGEAHALPRPFFVLATQNPLEFDATFPLPEAELDRFLMRVAIGYPSEEDEIELLSYRKGSHALSGMSAKVTPQQLLTWQAQVREVHVHPEVKAFLVQLVRATRTHPSVRLGASPRAGLGLLAAAQASAFLNGRDFVVPDDVLQLMGPVLGHRILLKSDARIQGLTVEDLLDEIATQIPVPGISSPEASMR